MPHFCSSIVIMIRIGTRGSKLALWQANDLKDKLESVGVKSELIIIKTKGDNIQHLGFNKMEGKGFFTKEIEEALIDDKIDVAVHSLKDLPTSGHPDLAVSGVSTRANPRDLLIIHADHVDPTRPIKVCSGATIGTSSIRRKVQVHSFDESINLVDIRGNVPTRINKVRTGEVDGIVLAAAGVERLTIDLSDLEVVRFNPLECVPAPAQGVIGYQCRKEDRVSRTIIKDIHHSDVSACTNVERKILNLLDGGCQLPLGAYCTRDANGHYHCTAILGTIPGEKIARASASRSTSAGLAEHIVSVLKNNLEL